MKIRKLTQEDALAICAWHYEGMYSFYDMESDMEDYEAFIDENKRNDQYYAVYKLSELIGFFCVEPLGRGIVSIGLGLKPEYTGRGFGSQFLKLIINFIQGQFSYVNQIRLSVACFNERAIKVYEKVGFIRKEIYKQKTNGDSFDFLKMEYSLKDRSVL